jgi:dTDP-glucose 4,6-dehydratase
MEAIPETYSGGPDQLSPASAYAEAKRLAELECAIAVERGVKCTIARMFAFVGPHLPLRRHFAIGNFIADALEGKPVVVRGDGTAVRSYLDADDMVDWLWAIFARGAAGRAYNVGSSHALSIAALAELVAQTLGSTAGVKVLGEQRPGLQSNRYVPDTSRIRGELGVRETVDLSTAIAKAARAGGA